MQSDSLQVIKSTIKALVISTPKNVSVEQLNRDYRENVGEDIPYGKMGHKSLEAFLHSMPETIQICRIGNMTIVKNVSNAKTSHIEQFVHNQKKNERRGKNNRINMQRYVGQTPIVHSQQSYRNLGNNYIPNTNYSNFNLYMAASIGHANMMGMQQYNCAWYNNYNIHQQANWNAQFTPQIPQQRQQAQCQNNNTGNIAKGLQQSSIIQLQAKENSGSKQQSQRKANYLYKKAKSQTPPSPAPALTSTLLLPQKFEKTRRESIMKSQKTEQSRRGLITKAQKTGQTHRESINKTQKTDQRHRESNIKSQKTEQMGRGSIIKAQKTDQTHRESINKTQKTDQRHRESNIKSQKTEQMGRGSIIKAQKTDQTHRESIIEAHKTEQSDQTNRELNIKSQKTDQTNRESIIKSKKTEQTRWESKIEAQNTKQMHSESIINSQKTEKNYRGSMIRSIKNFLFTSTKSQSIHEAKENDVKSLYKRTNSPPPPPSASQSQQTQQVSICQTVAVEKCDQCDDKENAMDQVNLSLKNLTLKSTLTKVLNESLTSVVQVLDTSLKNLSLENEKPLKRTNDNNKHSLKESQHENIILNRAIKYDDFEDAVPSFALTANVFQVDYPEDAAPFGMNIKIRDLSVNSIIVLYITKIVSPEQFFYHIGNGIEDFEYLCSDIQCFYETLNTKEYKIPPHCIREGQICAASIHGTWHRAIIRSSFNLKQDYVKVYLVDSGHEVVLNQNEIKFLLRYFADLPARVLIGSLANLKPKNDGKWSSAAVQRFQNLTFDRILYAQVTAVYKQENRTNIVLCDTNGSTQKNINMLLIQEGYAVKRIT